MGNAHMGFAPVKHGTQPRLERIGSVKTPDGRTLSDLTGSEIARLLVKIGIPGRLAPRGTGSVR